MSQSELAELEKYLPEGVSGRILYMIQSKNAALKITRHRRSKFGDYRSPQTTGFHQITVNGTLNPYAFLLTFLHEFAHLQIFEIFKNKVSPHGKEWKTAFALLIHEEIEHGTFPEDLVPVLKRYAANPKASTFSDPELFLALEKHNNSVVSVTRLSDLNHGEPFALGKKRFTRGELRRTRYLCEEISSGKKYLVHKNAEVIPIAISKH